MSRKLRPATEIQVLSAKAAVYSLKLAREYLRAAGSPQTLNRVRETLKSAEGALRHAQRRAAESK